MRAPSEIVLIVLLVGAALRVVFSVRDLQTGFRNGRLGYLNDRQFDRETQPFGFWLHAALHLSLVLIGGPFCLLLGWAIVHRWLR